jgi:hypothetical protein
MYKAVCIQAGEGSAAAIGISEMVPVLGHGGKMGGFTSVSGVALQAASHFWRLLSFFLSLARSR